MLTIENIEVTYYHTVQALRGLSLEVPDGKIVTLLGTNGAGKTTTLKAASNLLALENGEIGEGDLVEVEGSQRDANGVLISDEVDY